MSLVPDPVVGSLLDDAPCGFLAFGDDGTVRAVNATLLGMLGYTREDVIGHHVERVLAVGSRIFYQTHFFPLLRLHGHAEEIFLLLRARDGSDVAALVNAVRRQRDGEWVTDCVLLRIVERRKFEDALLRAKREAEEARAVAQASQHRLEEQAVELEAQSEELRMINDELTQRTEEMEEARREADRANEAKSQFLARMSHELRTPLNAIGGYVQLIELGVQGPVTDAQRESLSRVVRSQRHLLRLINEVLNLARVEAGHVEYRIERVPIAQLVEAVVPMVEPQMAARDLRSEILIDDDIAANADREKAEQILLNLLSNAVKFTPAAGRVAVEALVDASDPSRVAIRVRDTGIGISAEKLASVFDPFVQVKTDQGGGDQGTGLGLTISRDLARGMGGDLTTESEPNVGSTFTLTLPRA